MGIVDFTKDYSDEISGLSETSYTITYNQLLVCSVAMSLLNNIYHLHARINTFVYLLLHQGAVVCI